MSTVMYSGKGLNMDCTPVCDQLGRFADFCERADPIEVAQSITASDAASIAENLEVVSRWLDTFRSVFANAEAAP